MNTINETHDINRRSWVESANTSTSDFPIQNLPYGVFKLCKSDQVFRVGVAIGDQILDLAALADMHLFEGKSAEALIYCKDASMNRLMSLGQAYWHQLRKDLSHILSTDSLYQERLKSCLVAQSDAEYSLPAHIGDYTDFYTSVHHATNVGKQFRPDNPLLPNYKWVPIGYHGRSSSIGISGQKFHRPYGQVKSPDQTQPSFAPARRMDYELEVGIFIGQGNALGQSIPIIEAENHVFGLCLFNDWSARDIQAWEYQPLGPFLAKNFASTLSPWVVTTEAMAPFRTEWKRAKEDPQPLPYLDSEQNQGSGGMDIILEVAIQSDTMKRDNVAPERLAKTNFKHSYWSVAQLVTHHSSNGCNLNPGDLFGSGTQSGPEESEAGSMLELSKGGKSPITLSNGEQRSFVEDGDTIVMTGYCEREGAVRIGFGEVTCSLLPAQVK